MHDDTDIVIVGGGPVGLWTAIQAKKKNSDLKIKVYERYNEYKRSHVLKLEHFSLLLYGKNSKDPNERKFYKDITGKNLAQIFKRAATGAVFIRTNDLEASLKSYAKAIGVDTIYEEVKSPEEIMDKHPNCSTFIAADGAHSAMRTTLIGEGEDGIKHYPLQYVVEIKYEANGKAKHLSLKEHYKTNKLLSFQAFEYVGRTKDETTPITLRFFVDKQTYEAIPDAKFKKPLSLSDKRMPDKLAKDIQTYMNVRKAQTKEDYQAGSGKCTKLVLSLYMSRSFAMKHNERHWYFVGDAAMGVPYFRALNAGLINGSQLATILTRKSLSNAVKTKLYNLYCPLSVAYEFTLAQFKNLALKAYNHFRKASADSSVQIIKWDKLSAHDFQLMDHKAFKPDDEPKP